MLYITNVIYTHDLTAHCTKKTPARKGRMSCESRSAAAAVMRRRTALAVNVAAYIGHFVVAGLLEAAHHFLKALRLCRGTSERDIGTGTRMARRRRIRLPRSLR